MITKNYKEMTKEEFAKVRMDFQKMCYKMYLINWEDTHVTPEVKKETYREFMKKHLGEELLSRSYHFYLLSYGYTNEARYLSYPDFVCFVFPNEENVKEILGDSELFAEYQAIFAEYQRRLAESKESEDETGEEDVPALI